MASKAKKLNDNIDPTNAQLMRTLDALADKMDLLPNCHDLKQLEDKLTGKMHEQNREMARKTQDNTRDIRVLKQTVEQQQINVQKLTEQLSKQKTSGRPYPLLRRGAGKREKKSTIKQENRSVSGRST